MKRKTLVASIVVLFVFIANISLAASEVTQEKAREEMKNRYNANRESSTKITTDSKKEAALFKSILRFKERMVFLPEFENYPDLNKNNKENTFSPEALDMIRKRNIFE